MTNIVHFLGTRIFFSLLPNHPRIGYLDSSLPRFLWVCTKMLLKGPSLLTLPVTGVELGGKARDCTLPVTVPLPCCPSHYSARCSSSHLPPPDFVFICLMNRVSPLARKGHD